MPLIDLRSDTITKPSKEMLQAMSKAPLGDDVFGDDPTVNKLESKAAELMGKEAALFTCSGTQANLLSILGHTHPGDEVLLEEDSHVFNFEVANAARFAGAQLRPLKSINALIDPLVLSKAIRGDNIHLPNSSLVILENTQNVAGGLVYPLERIKKIRQTADVHNLKVHIDGARIFNASIYQEVEVKEYAQYADSITFCLSKGLGCPMGSILLGTKEFIDRSRKNRKALGGGLRQAGLMAGAGIYALDNNVKRLERDHANAQIIQNALKEIGCALKEVQTNIVRFTPPIAVALFLEKLKEKRIIALPFGDNDIRIVTHLDIKDNMANDAARIIRNLL